MVDFLMTDPAAVKILKVERGVPAIPAVQSEIEPVLDATGKMSLTFAQDLQDEVVPPPQVTPERLGVQRRGDPDRHRRAVRTEDSGRRRAGVAGGDRKQPLSQSLNPRRRGHRASGVWPAVRGAERAHRMSASTRSSKLVPRLP